MFGVGCDGLLICGCDHSLTGAVQGRRPVCQFCLTWVNTVVCIHGNVGNNNNTVTTRLIGHAISLHMQSLSVVQTLKVVKY